jgi:hypothetical protein
MIRIPQWVFPTGAGLQEDDPVVVKCGPRQKDFEE